MSVDKDCNLQDKFPAFLYHMHAIGKQVKQSLLVAAPDSPGFVRCHHFFVNAIENFLLKYKMY